MKYNIMALMELINSIRYFLEYESPSEEKLKELFLELRDAIDREFNR